MKSNPFLLMFSTLGFLNDRIGLMERDVHLARDVIWNVLRLEYGFASVPESWINTDFEIWKSDLAMFISEYHNAIGYRDRFFRRFAAPASNAYFIAREQGKKASLAALANASDCCWKQVMELFLVQEQKDESTKEVRNTEMP